MIFTIKEWEQTATDEVYLSFLTYRKNSARDILITTIILSLLYYYFARVSSFIGFYGKRKVKYETV